MGAPSTLQIYGRTDFRQAYGFDCKMPIDLDLPSKVLKVYRACIDSKEVLYYPSEVTKERNELKTEIRLCESLSKKPGPSAAQFSNGDDRDKEKAKKEDSKKEKKDVFDPANWDSLLVDSFDGEFGEEYGILLNKYAVVPLHFVLVTKHFEEQTKPLTPPQLLASYEVLQSFYDANKSADSPAGEILCFYNCGEMSGASQPHKHVQFAPMEGEGSLGNFPTEAAASAYRLEPHEEDKPFSLQALPYAHHIRRLHPAAMASRIPLVELMQHLQEVYLSLLDAMIDNLRSLSVSGGTAEDGEPIVDPSRIKLGQGLSYNLLMTRKHMHIIPRRLAAFKLPDLPQAEAQNGDDAVEGKAVTEPAIIGCNALAYTGTVLVKSTTDAERLVEVGGVLKALEACGYPKADSATADVHGD